MNKLLVISQNTKNLLYQHIEDYCQKKYIELIAVNQENYDEITIDSGDGIYRISLDNTAKLIEKYFLTKSVKSLYRDKIAGIGKLDNVIEASIIHEINQIPIPQTIYAVSKKKVSKYIEKLGLPMIVKVAGGSKGIGVIKADTVDSLRSIIDYLTESQIDFVLKQYIDVSKPTYSMRAVVIDEEISFIYKNINISSDDFRSNVDQTARTRERVELNNQQQVKDLINSVKSLGLYVGAVDFVIDQNGMLKIFEVNFPFNFSPIIEEFSYPVHEKILDLLLADKP